MWIEVNNFEYPRLLAWECAIISARDDEKWKSNSTQSALSTSEADLAEADQDLGFYRKMMEDLEFLELKMVFKRFFAKKPWSIKRECEDDGVVS